MKTKQMVGILVTGAVIIAVGVTGVVSNIVKSKFTQSKKSDVSSVVNNLMGEASVSLPTEDFIGVINIEGEIGPTETNAWKASTGYNHDLYMKYIDKMIKSSSNKGIMLYVDSPGGTVYESDELYLKLEEYKEKTGRILRRRRAPVDIIFPWQQIRFMQTAIAGPDRSVSLYH